MNCGFGLPFDMELQEYILTALADKTVIYVTHQVEFLPAADLILVWLYSFSCTFMHYAVRG